MTNQPQQPNPMQNNYYYPEDEIELIDYLRVLWKWKWLIIAGTLICAVAAAVISLQMPRIYEISTVIEPGITGVKDNGSYMYIDSVANISGKINEGVYNRRIQEALNLDPLKTEVEFKTAIVKEVSMIKLTSQWQEESIDLGMKVIGQLIRFFSDDYGGIIEHKKNGYDKQLTLKMSSIEKTRSEIKLLQATFKNVRQRKEQLLEEIRGVKDNTEKIVQQRDTLLKDKNPGKALSPPLFHHNSAERGLLQPVEQPSL